MTNFDQLRSEIQRSEKFSNGSLLLLVLLALVCTAALLWQNYSLVQRIEQTSKDNQNKLVEQTAIVTGQTQLLKDQGELIACLLAVHDNAIIGLKYDPAICKAKIGETNNFDGTFARDELLPPSQQPPKPNPQPTPAPDNGTCVPLINLCVKL